MKRQSDCIPLVCATPPEQLLSAVRANNLDLITRLVENDCDLHCKYYDNKTIIEAACSHLSDGVKPDTVPRLIELGANLEQPNEFFDNKCPIHFAAESLHPGILEEVLNGMEERNIDFNLITLSSNTALLHLLKRAESLNEHFLKCVKLLAEKVDVNCIDEKGMPAVYWAAKRGLKEVVNILKLHELDVDSYRDVVTHKTARDLMVEKNWFSSNDFPLYNYLANEPLAQKINSNQLTVEDLDDLPDVNREYHGGTMLQILVQRSLVDLIEKLMTNEKLDCNKTTKRNVVHPTIIALERADYETLRLLLTDRRTKVPDNLLCHALSNFDRFASPGRDYKKCAYVCVEEGSTEHLINKMGDSGNYPLHFACRYSDEDTILKLLEKKASLANRGGNDYLSMNDIRKRTLEAHLDSCLGIVESQPKNRNDEKEIRFDFTTLLTTKDVTCESSNIQIEAPQGNGTSAGYQGMDTKHHFNRRNGKEMDVPIFMSQSVELKPLLTHPMLATFLSLKWQQVSRIYYLNLTFYVALCCFLYTYTFLSYINEDFANYPAGIKVLSSIIYVANIISLIALILRECFQFLLEKLKYLKNIENYIELILVLAMLLMVLPILNDNYPARRQVASIAILFSAMELFLLIGKKPNLSTNIVILRTVSLTFLKLLLWYSILICAFALSFYTLFSGQRQEDGEDPNFFTNPALAAIKTIVMLTGEFDAGNIKFDSIPIISHVIFLMFVFMISMVLFNLLNGLAVADTQSIRNQSELHSYVSQIQYIAHIEELLANHQLSAYLQRLCKTSHFARDGPLILSVPLHQGRNTCGHFKGSESGKIPVRQSLVKRAKLIVEERKVERDANRARNAEMAKFEQMERMIEEMSKKIDNLSRNEAEL